MKLIIRFFLVILGIACIILQVLNMISKQEPGIESLKISNDKFKCLNNGICVTKENKNRKMHECICPEGFSGKNCEIRTKPIVRHFKQKNCNLACYNNGVCHIHHGSGEPFCVCLLGFSGLQCREDDRELLKHQPEKSNPIDNEVTCITETKSKGYGVLILISGSLSILYVGILTFINIKEFFNYNQVHHVQLQNNA